MGAAFLLSALSTTMAQTPPPPKSSITIKETVSDVPGPTPEHGKKCKMDHHLVTYTPTVVLGADAQNAEITWRFYGGIRTPRGAGIKLVSEKNITSGVPAEIAPITADASLWACSCCRPINKDNAKVIGWYAELVKDNTVIAQAHSATGGMEIADLVAKKQNAPRDADIRLSWVSPDKPQSTGEPEPSATSYIALASRKKFPEATRMKGPSGRSLYVSSTPLLAEGDIARAGTWGTSVTKVDGVHVELTPTGEEKLAAAKLSKDLILVVVTGETILTDEVSQSTSMMDGKEVTRLKLDGRLSKIEFEDMAYTLRPRNIRR